jgi:hypothetical protein
MSQTHHNAAVTESRSRERPVQRRRAKRALHVPLRTLATLRDRLGTRQLRRRLADASSRHALRGRGDPIVENPVKRRTSRRRPHRGREDAHDQRVRTGRAWSEQSGQAVGEQLLPDGLESGPAPSVRSRRRQSNLVEAVAAAEIGKVKTDSPAVVIEGEVVLGRLQ